MAFHLVLYDCSLLRTNSLQSSQCWHCKCNTTSQSDIDHDIDDVPPPSPRRSGRQNRGAPALRDNDVYEAAIDLVCLAAHEREALGGEQPKKWAAAMDNEPEFLWKNGVYVEVARLVGKKGISNVFWIGSIRATSGGAWVKRWFRRQGLPVLCPGEGWSQGVR